LKGVREKKIFQEKKEALRPAFWLAQGKIQGVRGRTPTTLDGGGKGRKTVQGTREKRREEEGGTEVGKSFRKNPNKRGRTRD